jgi:putative DNA methylase
VPDRPRVLIEDWLPSEELGIESRREAAPIPGQFPKLKTLHVWWARRPLAASAGAVLGSLMPAWTPALTADLPGFTQLASESNYHRWFLRLCGVLGDAVGAKRAQEAAIASGVRIANPYTYKPAFRNAPSSEDLLLLQRILERTWGEQPLVVDPTAGGGSLPFQSVRFGLRTVANDLNPVAAMVLSASVGIPASMGTELTADLREWGSELTKRTKERLEPFFPAAANESVMTYLFARTVMCPREAHEVPLSPNWWLSRAGMPVAVRLRTEDGDRQLGQVSYEITTADAIDFDPDRGTFSGGDATCPWDGLAIDGEYIKAELDA